MITRAVQLCEECDNHPAVGYIDVNTWENPDQKAVCQLCDSEVTPDLDFVKVGDVVRYFDMANQFDNEFIVIGEPVASVSPEGFYFGSKGWKLRNRTTLAINYNQLNDDSRWTLLKMD